MRKLQEELIFLYQEKVFWLQTNWQNAVYRHFSDGERYQRGMIALDYAGCTLHLKLAFQFAKRLFENLLNRKTHRAKKLRKCLKYLLQHYSASILKGIQCCSCTA